FKIQQSYNNKFPLIIDPTLIFSTFTGSTVDNWGMSATYDAFGDAYTSGIAFGVGYPVTTGAFQGSYAGGGHGGIDTTSSFYMGYVHTDISVSKFDPAGSTLLYSTYLGGSNNEQPQSIIVDNNNDLLIFGRTYSSDFPTTPGAYSSTLKGGADMIITKFDATGATLLASTYIGGSKDDGVNITSYENVLSSLKYNYSDDARGDILVDNNNNIYIAACTQSSDFPTTSGAFQTTFQGGLQDGCVFKLDASLRTLIWSTFLGGHDDDAAYSMAFDNLQNIFVTGGTVSKNFPTTAGALHTIFQGGFSDGFLTHFTNSGALMQSTYIGTSGYDQSYFVQTDRYGNPYLYGQTSGAYPVSAGVYSNPNSGQFIDELNNSLSTTIYSTVFGSGRGTPDISPTAFLVDKCENIYISGWGGKLYGYNQPTSSVIGMPITSNAFQPTTNDGDFYFAVFQRNLASLWYGTFFGGPISQEHVDGGTSRFDKSGMMYQAICGGCGGNSDMPTTPGVWSNTNKSNNCNNALVKFRFDLTNTVAAYNVFPNPAEGCAPFTVAFTNTSLNGTSYYWNFGDGDTSNLVAPTHTYMNPGTYNVELIGTNPTTCNIRDTAYGIVIVLPPLTINHEPDMTICKGDTVHFNATGGTSYAWVPPTGLSNAFIANPVVYPPATTSYTVNISTTACQSSDTINVKVNQNQTHITSSGPTVFCPPSAVFLNVGNRYTSYSWLGGQSTSNITVNQSGEYIVHTVDSNGCKGTDSIAIQVYAPVVPAISKDTVICQGQSVQLNASGGISCQWYPNEALNNNEIFNPIANPLSNITYKVNISNGHCNAIDTVTVHVKPIPYVYAGEDVTILPGETTVLQASGDSNYLWYPPYGLSCTHCANPSVSPDSTTTYYVTVSNAFGCSATDTVTIYVQPTLYIPNAFTPNGDGVNDVFAPKFFGIKTLQVYIYNRWGELIYQWNTLNGFWDGKMNGRTVQEDVYVYLLEAVTDRNVSIKRTGTVTVVR
ncbi:MAG: gliding motility-associated C-terminal domain-containing protein, partial [Bacteroidia bacterium]